MSFIHHAIAKKIKEDKEKDRTVREGGDKERKLFYKNFRTTL